MHLLRIRRINWAGKPPQLEDRWSVEYREEPDLIFVSLISCISTRITNWKIIEGDEARRMLVLVPDSNISTEEQMKIIGSEIEVRIVRLGKKLSRILVILRSSKDALKNESREITAKLYPINLLLTIGVTDDMVIDSQTLKDALLKHGGPITKTVMWHLNNRGFFEEKRGQQERLLANLREVFGPAGDLMMQDIMDRIRKKPSES